MKNLWSWSWYATAALLLAGVGTAAAKPATTPSPGTLNYLEGQASLDGKALAPDAAGSARLGANQTLDTRDGNAELLLTPGVFLRVGRNSEVRMLSPGLADTQVQLIGGSAMLEVDQLYHENNLSVVVDRGTTEITKTGLYEFSAGPPSVTVLDGKATVTEEDQHVDLKKNHRVMLASTQPLKAEKIDKDAVEADPLYRWSKLRSNYEAQANLDAARTVVVSGGWYGPGWYWDPYWSFYSFLPANGFFYNPFGWGFYSPVWVGSYGYPIFAGRGSRVPGPAFHHYASRGFHSAPPSGGFRGGVEHGRVGGFRGGFHR